MSVYGVADSAQLAVLAKALNDYCARHPVECKDQNGRERIGRRIMCLFGQGIIDPVELSNRLRRAG
ncbi:hypothetical protein [Mesorhizobium sp.]|uniref:hypothetical protein n=1 Tax=Mesorhizobium sp. TaxID=1871066 RepID=UPI0025ECEB35|nr:hypothetical protein [Mesorhizobium sp.]